MTKFFGAVNKNKFSPYNFEQYWNYLSTLEGKEVFCVVSKKTNSRSLPQNKLYWEWLKIIADYLGEYDKDEVHEILKHKFLAKKQIEIVSKATGEIESTKINTSTTKLTTKEMSEYMDEINRWALNFLGIFLPTPEDILR